MSGPTTNLDKHNTWRSQFVDLWPNRNTTAVFHSQRKTNTAGWGQYTTQAPLDVCRGTSSKGPKFSLTHTHTHTHTHQVHSALGFAPAARMLREMDPDALFFVVWIHRKLQDRTDPHLEGGLSQGEGPEDLDSYHSRKGTTILVSPPSPPKMPPQARNILLRWCFFMASGSFLPFPGTKLWEFIQVFPQIWFCHPMGNKSGAPGQWGWSFNILSCWWNSLTCFAGRISPLRRSCSHSSGTTKSHPPRHTAQSGALRLNGGVFRCLRMVVPAYPSGRCAIGSSKNRGSFWVPSGELT